MNHTTRPATDAGPGVLIPATTTRALVLLRRAQRIERMRLPFGGRAAARLRRRAELLAPDAIARRKALFPELFA